MRVDDCGINKRIVPRDSRSLLYDSSPVQTRPSSSLRVGRISRAEGGKLSFWGDPGDVIKLFDELRRGGKI